MPMIAQSQSDAVEDIYDQSARAVRFAEVAAAGSTPGGRDGERRACVTPPAVAYPDYQ
jgi:hypothetical protein